jgi:GTP-binding protein Era
LNVSREDEMNHSSAEVLATEADGDNRCGYVALVGRPNVGKSTLLNRLLGQKLAITSHKPQTTRHTILGVSTRSGGQILYVDTPGLHQRGGNALNRYLNRAARAILADVDLVLLVVEALRFDDEDALALAAIAESGTPALVAINKCDRVADKPRLLPFLQALAERHAFLSMVPVSALNGDQLERLEAEVLAALPSGENLFPPDQLTDRSERFLAAELLREQLMQRYGKELPYRTTVEIESFKLESASGDDGEARARIHALIWVERESQKAIIIGRRGEALKAAASQARLEMQKLFGRAVHLEVWVKVKQSWSSDEAALARLGYGEY